MNCQPQSSADRAITSLLLRSGLALLILSAGLAAAANGQSQSGSSVGSSPVHVTHVLGFEDVRRNVSGELSIQDDDLRFQRDGSPVAEVSVTSIQNISLGEQDKQVGGVPMMLGKAAVPFGGGRAVSLFSHKKYDSLAIEYRDGGGGFHGAIFRFAKGQGEAFKNALMAQGAHIARSEDPAPLQSAPEESLQAQKWSVQVDRVDPGATTLDPAFSNAIYENLLQALTKSKQFKNVFRRGDRNANDVPGVLVLKMIVEKYSPGSETRRAVTTVTGATKLKVHMQLVTRNGQVVLERTVEGNIRFMGDNLNATNKVANRTAKLLKGSSLPPAAALTPQQATAKETI
jgi:hypothetical protein